MSAIENVSILLVDDQEARLLSYEAILGDLRANLVRARSGTEALKRLMKEDFALILLDVNMPVMDGFETARMIRHHPRYEATPIVFVTAIHDTEFDRRKGYELGAVDYINIPIVPEILRSKVAVLVELYQKRRDLKLLNESLEKANQDLAMANRALLAEQARELSKLNDELFRANDELVRANDALKAEIDVRQVAEEALRNADRRKDEFLAVLAHELRNPLAPIRNGVEILRRVTSPEGRAAAEGMIERQVRHMTRLIDDLLDVSRITNGRIELRREVVDLRDILHAAREATLPLIEASDQHLEVALSEQALAVEGDPARLTQVVANLLNNASKFMDRGKRIHMGAAREGDEMVITVRDEGIGIPAEFQSAIFDMFSQVDRSLERSKGGLGIGLALARSIVDLHGGSIDVASEGEGKGSMLTVRLPAAASGATIGPRKKADAHAAPGAPAVARAEAALAATTTTAQPQASIAGRRILVADDNDDSAESMSLMLQLQGHQVFRAVDGEDALETASNILPEVVLLDIGMPRMNGYAAARRIREACGKDVVLIAVTGFGQTEDRRLAMDAGFDAHLTKPVEMAELRRLIEGRGRAAS
jgi:signal transduction histidine kinase/ActR/RegA family two-component response regulator